MSVHNSITTTCIYSINRLSVTAVSNFPSLLVLPSTLDEDVLVLPVWRPCRVDDDETVLSLLVISMGVTTDLLLLDMEAWRVPEERDNVPPKGDAIDEGVASRFTRFRAAGDIAEPPRIDVFTI